ncbi:MFS transporter [Asanoa iriomotensis]|uniref:MFS transporter n=1 Tax=Asanoa iriomotensis TaxID=234613 RepID=A0ABQ4C165_9ACTN|nr:MFS transporter [Asanoa iriomotensis]GIF56171.1 MFS transporter [Asanoa iriomotensis]
MATVARGGSASAVGAVVALQIAVTLPAFLVATLAPYLERDIGLSERGLGIAIGTFYAVSGATAVWLGRVADRQSWQRGLFIAAFGTLVPIAVLAGLLRNTAVLVLAMVALAVVQSLGVGTTNLAIVDSVTPHRQGVAFGVKQAAVPTATLLAGLSAPLIAEHAGWRWAFLFAATFPLIAVALTRWRHYGGAAASDLPATRGDEPVSPARARRLRTLAAAFAVATFTTSSLGAFFVLYAVDRGMSPPAAGLTVAVASVVNVTMRVWMGWVADHRTVEPFAQGGLLLLGGSVGYFVLLSGASWLLPVGAVLAYGLGWAWQGLIHLGAVRLVPEAPGYATGVMRTGLAIGSATGPVVAGLLIGLAGYRPLWLLLGVLAVCAAGAVLLTLRRPLETP